MMRLAWRGSSTWAASSCTRTPCARAISNIPDELRVDLDPGPGVSWADVRRVALEVKSFLEEVGLRGWPKTSGSRGMHVNVRIEPRWTFTEVRRAALALSRAIEKRAPERGQLQMVERGAPRRISRLQPEREGPDDMLGVFGAPAAGCSCVHASTNGTRFRTAIQPISPCSRFRSGSRSWEIRTQTWTRQRVHSRSCWNSRTKMKQRAWAMRLGRRTFARWRAKENALRLRAPSLLPKQPRKKMPLLVIANSPDKEAALAGLERWKSKHPEAARHLAVDDVLVDSMRGRSSTWTRIRVNLRNVPEALRPPQETPDPDDDPTREWRSMHASKRAAKKKSA